MCAEEDEEDVDVDEGEEAIAFHTRSYDPSISHCSSVTGYRRYLSALSWVVADAATEAEGVEDDDDDDDAAVVDDKPSNTVWNPA